MKYKCTVSLDVDAVDELVVNSLKEAYEDCVATLWSVERQKFDPIEDVLCRQEGLRTVLNYFMVPKDFDTYMNIWNNYTPKDDNESQATGSDK